VRTNGNPDLIGRCARYSLGCDRRYTYASYLIRGQLSAEQRLNAEFIKHHIEVLPYRKTVRREARTTAGNYNLSTAGIRNLVFIKPPLSLQARFASIVESIEAQKTRLKAHLAELDALFSSLQSRAFNGELVA
jgi:type I restriction enzyme S subunit